MASTTLPLHLPRRTVCAALALLPIAATCSGGRKAAAAPSAHAPLELRPPALDHPRHLVVTDALIAREREFQLEGDGADWVIELPREAYLTEPLRLHGRDQARHIVIIGGGIRPTPRFDLGTMRLNDDSDWAIYAQRGFTGATGGTFRFRVQERSYLLGKPPQSTRALRWNASPDEIKSALEEIAGPGAVHVVEGGQSPGGTWKIVPAPLPLLGRPVLDPSGLEGPVVPFARNVFAAAADCGLVLKQWRGTVHCEGLHLGGDAMCDGINVQNSLGGAIAQFANVHSAPRFHLFHDDWIHPDGAQFYLGPSVSRMENVDLISLGGNGFIAQPAKVAHPRALERLEPWWFRNCHFQAIVDNRNGRAADASTACFREIDPRNGPAFDQPWDCDEVYCSRTSVADDSPIHHDPVQKYYFYQGRDNARILIDRLPPLGHFADPEKGQCGPCYKSPGYLKSS